MVSLIITTYNYDQYVERAIRSAMDQSISKDQFEIIVVDDASSDNTREVLANYHEDCRIFILEENIGLAAARNFGIKKAKGQFIVFLDADDYLHRDMLSVERLFLEMNNDLDAVSTDYFLVDEKGKHLRHVDAVSTPIACGIMFRKDYLFHIGLYDESFRAREEEDLRIRFLKHFKVYNLCIPLYRYRMHNDNLTKKMEQMNFYASKLEEKHKTEE
ncbi:MAG: glycosyltransferase family A protein [Flavobacteriales bacterium]|nr:glycosyltransferase family A protein [Flavobacteriales bacterium]